MSATDEILAGIDPQQLAAALGTDEATAMNAAKAAIPTLIGSLQANATSTEGSQGLLNALGQHAGGFGDTIDLDQVDTADGQRIVAHALADDPQRLQAVSGLGGDLLSKLLPLLAPIVMSYLARKLGMGGSDPQLGGSGQDGSGQGGSGNILGDLLGGIFGGAGGAAAGGGLGDILGQILGGGQAVPAPTGTQTTSAPTQGSGTIFNTPDGSGSLQIPEDDTGDQGSQPQQGSGDILGGLLGQILGR